MTDNPAGWHPDPRGRHEHRYWDGSGWTDHVADNGVMSVDDVSVEKVEIAAPIGPSMVNLPAINLADLQAASAPAAATPTPTPVAATPTPTPTPTPAATEPVAPSHRDQAGPEDALESVADAFENAAASLAHKPLSLAAILTVIAPGSGHLYLGVQGARRTIGMVLVAATVAAVVFCYIKYPIGLLIYVAALAFALYDLRGELAPVTAKNSEGGPLAMFSDLGSALAWRLVIAGGALLVISLFLPWYHITVEAFGQSASANASAFDAFKIIDLILLVIGIAGIAAGVLNLRSSPTSASGNQLGTLVAAAGALAFLLVCFRLLFVPDAGFEPDIDRAFGALLAFASSALLAGGAAGAASARS